MYKILVIFLLCLTSSFIQAQDTTEISAPQKNVLSINPAWIFNIGKIAIPWQRMVSSIVYKRRIGNKYLRAWGDFQSDGMSTRPISVWQVNDSTIVLNNSCYAVINDKFPYGC